MNNPYSDSTVYNRSFAWHPIILTAYFYRAIENQHRDAGELIKSRLRVYRTFLLPLAATPSGYSAPGLWQRQVFVLWGMALRSMTYDQALKAASNAEGMP